MLQSSLVVSAQTSTAAHIPCRNDHATANIQSEPRLKTVNMVKMTPDMNRHDTVITVSMFAFSSKHHCDEMQLPEWLQESKNRAVTFASYKFSVM